MLIERRELGDMLDRLDAFILSEAFRALPDEDQSLLRRQADAMRVYENILDERIARFDAPG
ncbi:MAG TPA: hypothetical protein VGG68_11490 [Caulobacteraceae bacterium]